MAIYQKGVQRHSYAPQNVSIPVLRPLALSFRQAWPSQRRSCIGSRWQSCTEWRWHGSKRKSCIPATKESPSALHIQDKRVFYRQLAEVAQLGNTEAAEACVAAMRQAGLEVTPHVYHGLIFCYAKAGVVEAAVKYFYGCLEKGLQPLAETYAVVIHACFEAYETTIVEEIYTNLLGASVNRRPGWQSYLHGLTSLGLRSRYHDSELVFQTRPEEMAAEVSDREDPLPDLEDDDPDDIDDEEEPAPGKKRRGRPRAERQAVEEEEAEDYTLGDKLEEESRQEEEDQVLDSQGLGPQDSANDPTDAGEEQDPEELALEIPYSQMDPPDGFLAPDDLSLSDFDGVEVTNVELEVPASSPGLVRDPQSGEVIDFQPESTEPLNGNSLDFIPVFEVEPDNDESSPDEAITEQEKLLIEQRRQAALVAYHPGKPDGKLYLLDKITETMDYGRQEGWYTDLDTYEHILGLLCEDPEQAVLAQDILNFDLLNRQGVAPETRHYNCILRAEATWRGVRHAKMTVDDMIEGKYGEHIRPDISSMNAMLEGCLVERMTGKAYAMEDFQEVIAGIITAGLKMNKRTHALQLMVYLLEHDVDKTLWELGEMERLAARSTALSELSDEWLADLLTFLMDNQCVLEVLRLMLVMDNDARPIPEQLKAANTGGRSFYTQWLPQFFSGCHLGRNNLGLEKYDVVGNQLEFEGVSLDAYTGEAMAEDGLPMQPSSMTKDQLHAELRLLDVSTSGSIEKLRQRLQRARDREPEKIAALNYPDRVDESPKALKKATKLAEKEASGGKWIDHISLAGINHKRASNYTFQCNIVEPQDAEERTEKAYFEELMDLDLSPEITALLKEYRAAVNGKDVERQYMLETRIFDTDDPDFLTLNPHFNGRQGFGLKMTWPTWGKGSRLALYMMDIAVSLEGNSTFLDYLALLEGFIIEEDAEGCYELLQRLQAYTKDLDHAEAELFYSKALTLCMQCDRLELAHNIGLMMEEMGLRPLGVMSDPNFLPSLRIAALEAQSVPDYEREVGAEIGEALGGVETHRMSDLEGRWDAYPEGTGEIYRNPRQELPEEVLGQAIKFLPPGEGLDEGTREDLGDEDDEDYDDEDPMESGPWSGEDAEAEGGLEYGEDANLEDEDDLDPGEDPYFDGDWDIENDTD